MQTSSINEELVNNLIDGFLLCQSHKSQNLGGKMRATKGETWELFALKFIKYIVQKYKLPFIVGRGYKVNIQDDLNITMDLALLDRNGKPIFHFEIKDYSDLSMYKRFMMDNLILSTKYPLMKFISLTGQIASPNYIVLNNLLKMEKSTNIFSLLGDTRVSKNDLLILNKSREDLIVAIDLLEKKLSSYLIENSNSGEV